MALLGIIAFISQIATLVVIIGLSMTVTITIALLKDDFDGYCPLYPTVKEFLLYFNSTTNCNFLIGMNCVSMFFALAAGIYITIEVVRSKRFVDSAMAPIVFAVSYGILAVMVLAAACVTTVGFNKLCDALISVTGLDFVECIHFQTLGVMQPYDWTHFHDYLVAAETAGWLSFVMWLAMGAMTLLFNVCCSDKL